MSKAKRKAMRGRGAVGKAAVVGTKDRATNRVAAKQVPTTDAIHIAGFVADQTREGAVVYTDEVRAYKVLKGLYNHHAVNHSVDEYVRGQAHTNGMESFWSILKRGYIGTHHWWSAKHLQRYVAEFAGRHNVRAAHTVDQMRTLAEGMIGRRVPYAELVR